LTVAVRADETCSVELAAERVDQLGAARNKRRPHEDGGTRDLTAVVELDAVGAQLVAARCEKVGGRQSVA
jgi:hypothetical protein